MKNKKGFTLIELLAVIVILGLLMAIAIPSVTKYITQSRKKTVTSTIGNYIGALVNDVNDLSYTFTETNTVYAVPIECIALERGGTNPFGHWLHANDAYWAYVLVQYDDETSSYTYGYTFKDSAGYGLYPTAQSKLNEQGKQIQTGLSLSRPTNGKVTAITSTTNWSGFGIDSSTDLVVLTAAKEGEVGDGKTTCTLQQKGDNYASVEQENNNSNPTTPPKEEPTIKEGYLSGTWIINENAIQDSKITKLSQKISFTSYNDGNYNVLFTGFEIDTWMTLTELRYEMKDTGEWLLVYNTIGGATEQNNGYWYDDANRTIMFTHEQQVSTEFYNWFIANATKIS